MIMSHSTVAYCLPVCNFICCVWSREIDNAAVDISSDHHYDNTDELGEKIER